MNPSLPARDRYIGIDGGGTKTACLIGDAEGNVLARCSGEASNAKSRPWEEVTRVLGGLIREALERSGTSPDRLAGIFLGLAGSDRPEDRKRVVDWLREEWPADVAVTVHNDAVTALSAGTWGSKGLVVICGTGSLAYGYDPASGAFVRAGGWGYLLGDEGSGFDLGRKALTAVMREYDGRGEPTALTERVLERWGLEHPGRLINAIYGQDNVRAVIADVSKLVVAAAAEGDAVAERLLEEAASELTLLVSAAAEGMSAWPAGEEKEPCPLVLTGGLFSDEAFGRRFRERLAGREGAFDVRPLDRPPVVGAYLLALMEAGLKITEPVKRNIDRGLSPDLV